MPVLAKKTTAVGEHLRVAGHPWGLAATREGDSVFAVLGGEVDVLSTRAGRLRPIRSVTLPSDVNATGAAVTPDGRLLVVASNGGAVILSVPALITGAPALLGELHSPDDLAYGDAVEVSTSRDGRFAFVSLERSGALAVFDLDAARASRWRHSGYVGRISLGSDVVGSALSPDGALLYVTSQEAARSDAQGHGSLSVLSVATLATRPPAALVQTVSAGCSPVRVAVSPDGRHVAVSARGDNAVLLFRPQTSPGGSGVARYGKIMVGPAPVGLAFCDDDHLAVANSDRFDPTQGQSSVDVVSLSGSAGMVVKRIEAGAFPRELLLLQWANLLIVGDYGDGQLQALPLAEVS